MGILQRIGNVFRPSHADSPDDLFDDAITSQQALDPETIFQRFIQPRFGVPHRFNLAAYLQLFLFDDLAYSIATTDAFLTKSPLECVSSNDDTCRFIDDFNERIGLTEVIHQMLIDLNVFGFTCWEVYGNAQSLFGATEIGGLFRVHPLMLHVQKDERGRVQAFIQRPKVITTPPNLDTKELETFNNILAAFVNVGFQSRQLDPRSIVFISTFSPMGSVYGHSMYQSISAQMKRRRQLITAATISARNHANPILTADYRVSELRQEHKDEVSNQRKRLRKQVEAIDKKLGKWLVSGGAGEYNYGTLGFDSIPDLAPLIENLTNSVVTASGLSPQSMGYSTGGFTSSETSERVTLNSINSTQTLITEGLKHLYDLLTFIEPVPSDDYSVRMQEVDLTSLKERYEARSIEIANVERELRMGMESPEGAARRLGKDEPFDENRLDEFLAGPGMADGENNNDPNDLQQTKAVNRSLADGNDPGQNPKGN